MFSNVYSSLLHNTINSLLTMLRKLYELRSINYCMCRTLKLKDELSIVNISKDSTSTKKGPLISIRSHNVCTRQENLSPLTLLWFLVVLGPLALQNSGL